MGANCSQQTASVSTRECLLLGEMERELEPMSERKNVNACARYGNNKTTDINEKYLCAAIRKAVEENDLLMSFMRHETLVLSRAT